MNATYIDTSTLSKEDYWKHFQKLIIAADGGTTFATLGWVLFWLDHIPQHVIHTHFVTGFLFVAALGLGIMGAWVMGRTRNRLGARSDRFFHLVKITYTLMSASSGMVAYIMFPPV